MLPMILTRTFEPLVLSIRIPGPAPTFDARTNAYLQSVQLARAHFAYSLGNPSECLSILSSVWLNANSSSPNSRIPSSPRTSVNQTSPSSSPEKEKIRSVNGNTTSSAVAVADSIARIASTTTVRSQQSQAGGKIHPETIWWLLERIRGRCEEGPLACFTGHNSRKVFSLQLADLVILFV